jgi:hypothetical protein
MAGNLTSQVRNIADVTKAVAAGDLSEKITVDVKGEILELKATINTMVDQLSSFAAEVTRVARAYDMSQTSNWPCSLCLSKSPNAGGVRLQRREDHDALIQSIGIRGVRDDIVCRLCECSEPQRRVRRL